MAIAATRSDMTVRLPDIRLGDFFDIAIFVSAAAFLAWQTWLLNVERPELWDISTALTFNGALALAGFMVALRRKFPILLSCFFFDYIFFAIAPIQQLAARFDPIFGH